jgi:hypothetical protein
VSATPLGIDPGLLGRFRSAGGQIVWREIPPEKTGRAPHDPPRVAHLNDEESRVEERSEGPARILTVESGPLGALVLLLRWDERGEPNRLLTLEAGELAGFPTGALEARWLPGSSERALAVPLSDLVGLARYALA